MSLDLEYFSERVASVLEGYPHVDLPLSKADLIEHPQLDSIARQPSHMLFPGGRDPEAAHSGLLLLLGGWEQSHEIAQTIDRLEGSYWHAIIHRAEPDTGNAGYWFRRVGPHPIFEELRRGAAEIVKQNPSARWNAPAPWNPFEFAEFYAKALAKKDSPQYRVAAAIHSLEWRLLFEWCAANTGG
jgi:hypothetical protein